MTEKQITPLGYYEKVLGESWHGMAEQSEWFQRHCDSQLEVLFGLSLCGTYLLRGNTWDNPSYPWVQVGSNHIAFSEPFSASPTNNGSSAAFLTAQHESWDFCMFTANDNGATFGGKDTLPVALIDIDGYGIHRNQRGWDETKSRRAIIRSIRLPEERFRDTWQMAEAVIFSTIWACDCDMGEPCDELDRSESDCPHCGDAKMRAIYSSPNQTDQ